MDFINFSIRSQKAFVGSCRFYWLGKKKRGRETCEIKKQFTFSIAIFKFSLEEPQVPSLADSLGFTRIYRPTQSRLTPTSNSPGNHHLNRTYAEDLERGKISLLLSLNDKKFTPSTLSFPSEGFTFTDYHLLSQFTTHIFPSNGISYV